MASHLAQNAAGQTDSQVPPPADDLAGALLRSSLAAGQLGAQDGPDDDPQLAGNGFLATDAVSEALEWFEPVAAEPSDGLKRGLGCRKFNQPP